MRERMGVWPRLLTWTLVLSALGSVSSLQNVTGIQGGSVDLSANLPLPELQKRLIVWSFNAVQIVTQYTNSPPVFGDQYIDRCELFQNTTLRLRDLTAADQGEYTLRVTDISTGKITDENFQLTVYSFLAPPNVTFLSANGSYHINGTDATLYCDDLGQAVDSYGFHHGQEDACTQSHVTCMGPYLNFHPILQIDEGNYTCTIHNPVSISTSYSQYLKVAVPVSEVMIQSNTSSNESLWTGKDSVSLNCSALGTDVQFSWNHNGVPLPPNIRYHLNQNNSTVTISPVGRNDAGPFTCVATNYINHLTSPSLSLSLAWHPEGRIRCSASMANQTVQLLCSWTGGFPAADVQMLFQNQSETGQDQVIRNVHLNSLSTGDELSCYGTQGGQEVACVLKLDIPQAVEFTNNSNTEAEEGTLATMTVSLIPGSSVLSSRAALPETQILPSTFSWFHFTSEANPVPNDGRFMVKSTDYVSNLTISSVTMNEAGTYECRAENLIGSSNFFFVLNVTSNKADSSSSGLGPGEIAGIVIGALAGLAIIGVIAFFVLKKRKRDGTPKVDHVYATPNIPPPNIYDRIMPGKEMGAQQSTNEGAGHYEQSEFSDNSQYSRVIHGYTTYNVFQTKTYT